MNNSEWRFSNISHFEKEMGLQKKCENEKRNLYGICSLNGMYNFNW